MKTTPFFSILVVSYNAVDTIRQTVTSVLEQDFTDYEIVVKDACSSDGTVANLPQDDKIFVYETKDHGIYDGMNEAVRYAKGKYLLFLNCGDVLYDRNILSRMHDVASLYDENNTVLYGDYCRGDIYCKQPSKLTPFYLYRTPLCHQTMFFGKPLFDRFGEYNLNYKICADYEFTLRTYKANVEYVYCPGAVCRYLGGGASESEKGKRIKKNDYQEIKNTYYSAKERTRYGIKLFLSFRKLRQKLASDRSPVWVRKLYRRLVNLANR